MLHIALLIYITLLILYGQVCVLHIGVLRKGLCVRVIPSFILIDQMHLVLTAQREPTHRIVVIWVNKFQTELMAENIEELGLLVKH